MEVKCLSSSYWTNDKNIDGVEEAIVIGEPHPRFGEIAVLLYTGSIELEYQTVRQHIMKVLSRYDVPPNL